MKIFIKQNIMPLIGLALTLFGLVMIIIAKDWANIAWPVIVLFLIFKGFKKTDLYQKLVAERTQLQDLLDKATATVEQLTNRVDELRKQRSDYAAKAEDVQGQLQALDNEYLKLAKQHNDQGEELSKLKKEYDSLVQNLPFEAPVPTTPPKPKKNPTTATSKKAKYTKKDIARIHEEMKAGGMIKQSDDEE